MANQIKVVRLILIIISYLMLIFPVLEMKLHFLPEKKNTENRKLNPLPNFDVKLLDPFPKKFEAYFDDHFGARGQIVSMNNYLHKKILKTNNNNSSVIIGKDDYLYWASQSLPQHRNYQAFTPSEVENIVTKFKVRNEWLKQQGIRFYVIFAPVKQRIYPEYLPFSFANYAIKPKSDQIYDALKKELPDMPLIDVREKLLDARAQHETYPKADNHWNEYGGFVASTELLNRIRFDFPSIKPHSIKDYNVVVIKEKGGNLATILNLENEMMEFAIKLNPTFKNNAEDGIKANYEGPNEFKYNDDFELVKVVKDASLPKAVIIRDSFARSMIPYLSENFSKSVYIWDAWQYKENRNIITQEKPDLVILEIVEDKLEQMLPWSK